MRFSRPKPSGGYDYYDLSGDVAIGDDLPTPKLKVINGIGAASTESGRTIPSKAKLQNSGDKALGFVAPMEAGRLGKVTLPLSGLPFQETGFWVGASAVGAIWAVVAFLRRR